jgi:L-lactate dehydrogenase complex protein LldE
VSADEDRRKSAAPPRVALFVPCYIDLLYPRVGLAALALLERHGAHVDYPRDQTCCGQPLANMGLTAPAAQLARRFVAVFAPYDYTVAPSGSCVAMVRRHYFDLIADEPHLDALRARTFELCEFLVDVLGVEAMPGRFPHRVVLHPSCHGLRELRLAGASERSESRPDKVRSLLASLAGIDLVQPTRADECCGFGGSFSLDEEPVATMMGRDRLDDFERAGAEIVTATDVSCLAHLEGLIRRDERPLRVMHVAEILAAAVDAR